MEQRWGMDIRLSRKESCQKLRQTERGWGWMRARGGYPQLLYQQAVAGGRKYKVCMSPATAAKPSSAGGGGADSSPTGFFYLPPPARLNSF